MTKETKKAFDDYLAQFETSEAVNVDIKKFLLENIGLRQELEPIVMRFHEIALKNNYAYSIALSYAFLFFIYISKDVEKAISYNEKARELFLAQEDYKERDGILTVANNAVLAYIFKKDYMSAYKEIVWALPIAQKRENLTYYRAFLNNGALILNEFGLYKKAIRQVKESLPNKDLLGKSSHFTNIYVLANLYLNSGDTKSVYELLDANIDMLFSFQTYDGNILYRQYLEAAMLDNDRSKADFYYEKLMANYDFDSAEEADNNDVYLSLGRYYLYINEYEKSQDCFEIILQDLDKLLGQKQILFENVAALHYAKKEYKEAYDYLWETQQRAKLYTSFVDTLYCNELDDVWEKMRMESYELLFERLLGITEFGKIVAASSSLKEVFEVVQTHIPGVFSFDQCSLQLYDQSTQSLYSLNTQHISIQNSSLLQDCILNKKVIRFGNILASDSIASQLGDLYDSQTRSIFIQPIAYQNNVLAILCMKSKHVEAFTRMDQSLLQVMSDYIAIALENVMKFESALVKTSHDYLTGIYNRSALMHYGEKMLQEAKDKRRSIGTLMMDIDDFKKVNDNYGHIQGDKVICAFTSIIDTLKGHGMIARFGGEEFIMLINDVSMEELYQLAEAVRYQTEKTVVETEQGDIHFTVSIGCFYMEIADASLQELFEMADQRLYIAKQNGKNCVQM